jgi:MscS family membrane protein
VASTPRAVTKRDRHAIFAALRRSSLEDVSHMNARSPGARGLLALLLVLAVGVADRAVAQDAEAGSPRSTVEFFLHATAAGQYDAAATVFPAHADPTLAAKLRAVLDESLTIDPAKISDSPEGRLDDHLPANIEELGRVPYGNGSEPVRLYRDSAEKWVFAPSTLARVPDWYEALPDRWIRQLLPERLLRAGPRGVLWWQWVALVPITAISFLLGWLLAFGLRHLLRAVARRTTREFDTGLLHRLAAPLFLLAAVAVGRTLMTMLFFTHQAETFADALTSALALLAFFWVALRSIDLGIDSLRGSIFAKGRPERIALLPLFSKAAKLGLGVIAVVEVLQRLGYPAASLIAGLGIGGLAIALAAQKTLENLLGSVILGIDQPFRPGDTVKIDDLTGTVESIGLRSTRIRTAGRTVVTMPNGRLSDMRIESFAPRDRMRLDLTLSLVQATKPDQIRQILTEIEVFLKATPQVQPESVTVFLTALTQNSVDVTVGLFVTTTSDLVFAKLRQDILLRLLDIVEKNGSALAMPARAVHLANG